MVIPRRLIRSVPEKTSLEVEGYWSDACDTHPDWAHDTYRDPIDPERFPLTSKHWDRVTSGAQLAGLVRLEALWWGGGIWLDSDIELYRPLDPLLACDAFACWEDQHVVPDAVIGASARHPAIKACIDLALRRLVANDPDWRVGSGAWGTGPGVTTTVFPGRDDVLLLPPGSFYPVHYRDKHRIGTRDHRAENPWAFGIHRWHASWVEGA